MDGNGRQNRPGAALLDPKLYPDEKRQAICPARAHVAKDAHSCRKSGQNRMEEPHRGIHINALLQHPMFPSIAVQQLPERGRLDQAIHQQISPTHPLAMDL
jgi:hypothetical protein